MIAVNANKNIMWEDSSQGVFRGNSSNYSHSVSYIPQSIPCIYELTSILRVYMQLAWIYRDINIIISHGEEIP